MTGTSPPPIPHRRAPHSRSALCPGLALLLVGAMALAGGCTSDPGVGQGSGSTATTPETPSPELAPIMDDVEFDLGLPFRIEAPAAGPSERTQQVDTQVIETDGSEVPADVVDRWSLGGDFSRIASFPLDRAHVFGSFSPTPEHINSYGAAILGADTVDELTDPDPDDYFEPQDGSATDGWIVWRSSTVNGHDQTTSGVDNWKIESLERSSGAVRVLATAQDLNGVDTTPATRQWAPPTLNAMHAYFSSNVGGPREWTQVVLRASLDGSGVPEQIGVGGSPAALEDGVLYAAPDDEHATTLTRVIEADSGEAGPGIERFSVVPGEVDWQVEGLWAAGPHRAVAISAVEDPGAGVYLGLWDVGTTDSAPDTPGFPPRRWVHVPAPTATVSLNVTHLAWGSGSQQSPAQMFLMKWDSDAPELLGDAPGYSRPALAHSSPVVLIPRSTPSQVSWDVAVLP